MRTGSGPRDWSPRELPGASTPPHQWRAYQAPARSRPRNGAAWMSLLFGVGAILLGVVPFLQPHSDGRWFVFSTVGFSAIALGLHARRLWRTGCASAGRLPKLGVWLG